MAKKRDCERPRAVTACLHACLVLASLTAIAAAQGDHPGALETRNASLKAEDGKTLTVEHGRFQVPENRSKADSRSITLALVRIKSPLPNPGTPVFFLAGGPGGSSIRAVTALVRNGGHRFFELIGGDIVGIDQRGVGRSSPNLETPTKFDIDVAAPGEPTAILAKMQLVCREEAKRWRDRGVDLDGYTTVESADDINDVRKALGYDKIALMGSSYGSHLAMATIRRHESTVDRALLIGPEGPDHTLKLPSYGQEALERLAEMVAADKVWSARLPDLVGTVTEILQRLEDGPVTVEYDGHQIGISQFDVQQSIAGALGTVSELRELPRRIDRMAAGDFQELAKTLLTDRREAGIWSAMQMMMDCASGVSDERRATIEQESQQCLLGDAANFPFGHLAEAWSAPDLGKEFRSPLNSGVPVLIMVGALDAKTPVRNAREILETLPNGQMIVVDNAAHDMSLGMPELKRAWSDFLTGKPVTVTKARAGALRFALPEGVAAEAPEGTVQVAPSDLAMCVGRYRFENGMMFLVKVGDGRLIATVPGKGDFDLWPKSPTVYVCEDENIPDLTFAFRKGAKKAHSLKGAGKVGKRVR